MGDHESTTSDLISVEYHDDSSDTASTTHEDSAGLSSLSGDTSETIEWPFPAEFTLKRRLRLPYADASSLSSSSQEDLGKVDKYSFQKQDVLRIVWGTYPWTCFVVVSCILFLLSTSMQYYHYHSLPKRWRLPSSFKVANALSAIRHQSAPYGLTVRIKGDHVDKIHESLGYHASCPVVKSIQIDWKSNTQNIPMTLLQHPSGKVSMLQNEKQVDTHAVMLLSEDILLSCDDLERAWRQWERDPIRLVGFLPYSSKSSSAFSLLSDSAVLFHRFYLRTIRHATLPSPCGSVALSAWTTALSGESPVAISSHVMVDNDVEFNQLCQRLAHYVSGIDVFPTTKAALVGENLLRIEQ